MQWRSIADFELTRVYWMLIIDGPLTLFEITERTGWTKHRANQRLYQLREAQCVELLDRKQHAGAYNTLYNRREPCGKWAAISDLEPDVIIVTVEKDT